MNKRKTVVLIILLAGISLGAGVGFAIFQNAKSDTSEIPEGAVNAKQYFHENSKVKDVLNNSSEKLDTVQTEAEVIKEMKALGFDNIVITSMYDMNGEYSEKVITDTSSEKHPLYQGDYVTPEGDYWTIYSINGYIMAYPVSYNTQEDVEVVAVLSETNELMSYDSVTNTFYKTIPKEDMVRVVLVDHLNSETVASYTIERLGE